jgi:hypothetical protein
MSGYLTPGVRSLQLRLDTPLDTITGIVRNDLIGVKVWYSTINNFNVDTQGTLAFNGLSLSINIPNLTASTLYYVKYAFISAIDPTVYTVSTQLSATVLSSTEIVGSLANAQFTSSYAIINLGGQDVDVELRFDRTTGGPASITWNGQTLQCSKPFISQELGINNISATEPANPFAKQVWLQIT